MLNIDGVVKIPIYVVVAFLQTFGIPHSIAKALANHHASESTLTCISKFLFSHLLEFDRLFASLAIFAFSYFASTKSNNHAKCTTAPLCQNRGIPAIQGNEVIHFCNATIMYYENVILQIFAVTAKITNRTY